MKYLPIIATAALFSASAMAAPSEQFTSVGKSDKAPKAVAQCIASAWADKTQQPVVSQTVIANDMGVDVLVPGQAPGGDAATVRPSLQGPGTWVGFRSTSGTAPDQSVTGAITGCL